jgi:hypothetical protein
MYPDERGPVPEGNFFLWLGDGGGAAVGRISKLYLNPWAALPSYSGTLCLYRVLQEAGVVDVGVRGIERMVSGPLQAYPHIIGCDLDESGLRSLKLYFVQSVCDRKILEDRDAPWASPAFQSLMSHVPQNVKSGEVHAALTFRPNQHTFDNKINLYCPHWFPSDDAVVRALAFPLKKNSGLLDGWENDRRFTFVSASDRQATLYCRVGVAATS